MPSHDPASIGHCQPSIPARSNVTMPDDGYLLDMFCKWVPDPAVRDEIPVANPARLYRLD